MKQCFHAFVTLMATGVLMAAVALAQSGHRVVIATVTAYSSHPKAITASGIPAFDGVAACPRKYPFGTHVQIEGKTYECLDRPAGRHDNRFDVWKPSRRAARRFGKKRVVVVAIIPSR
jgi:3D (Asp-Asp-Asp) domain-containing protein